MNRKNIPLKDRIIFALDVDSKEEAKKWIDTLGSHISFFKVGLQLFIGGWFPVIEMITDRGHKVMCDLKLCDVPATITSAVRQLRNKGITFATVIGNAPIVQAAVSEKNGVKILAVTVLTSISDNDIKEMGYDGKIEDLVLHRAQKALHAGCDGIISSGLEAPLLRSELGDNFLIVTPGIRTDTDVEMPGDDQKRIMTAQSAIINGADYVVVGRPIRTAKNPIAVVESMQHEIEKGLSTYPPPI